jgi:hypothetical protein
MSENIISDGEHKCIGCDGTGYLNVNDKSSLCPICYGTGKLTWTELIVGKKNPLENIEGFKNLTLPLLRSVFPKLVASKLVSVQPIEEPIYYMKSKVKKNDRTKRNKTKG